MIEVQKLLVRQTLGKSLVVVIDWNDLAIWYEVQKGGTTLMCKTLREAKGHYDNATAKTDGDGLGNAAAMREALNEIRKALQLDSGVGPISQFHVDVDMLTQAALAAPARNCDKFASYVDALAYFNAQNQPLRGTLRNCRIDGADYYGMADWLFAPAKEGGVA